MAEERNLAARMADATDEEPSKAELQRRMEEARESISQTVAEIKDTVMNQYQAVKETLDWREQVRRRPVAWSLGALGVGFVLGYAITGAFKGDGEEEEFETQGLTPEDTRVFNVPPIPASQTSSSYAAPRSYAAQAITGGAHGSSAYAGGAAQAEEAAPTTDSTSAPGLSQEAEEEEPQGPGFLERFKQTKAYDRLEEEVSHLGERFIEELSRTAQTVVLPALFSKVKDLFGVDLSGRQGQATTGGGAGSSTAQGSNASTARVPRTQGSSGTGTQTGGSGGQGTQGGGGSSYGTSANQAYGTSAQGSGQQSGS